MKTCIMETLQTKYKELQFHGREATLKTICKTEEFVLQENFQCSQGTEMLERPVGIWQGLLQIMKHLNTYMCLMMETARISITGERAPPETHYAISKGLLGSVMLRVVLLPAKSVIAPLPGKALPPLGISSS